MAAPDLAHKSHFGADLAGLFHMHAPENCWVFVDARLHRDRSLAAARRDHQAAATESAHAQALDAIRAIFRAERALEIARAPHDNAPSPRTPARGAPRRKPDGEWKRDEPTA